MRPAELEESATLYVITNRRLYGANESQARSRLLELAAVWAANSVAYIQLREKDLAAREQVELAQAMLRVIRGSGNSAARLLINGRPDVALAAGADGVHLPSGPDELTPDEVRRIFIASGRSDAPVISISCHSLGEVEAARSFSPDCILFAPVFEKRIVLENGAASRNPQFFPGTGLELLGQACRLAAPIPVFALGGVSAENAAQCMDAGASGIAAIRLFLEPPPTWLSPD